MDSNRDIWGGRTLVAAKWPLAAKKNDNFIMVWSACFMMVYWKCRLGPKFRSGRGIENIETIAIVFTSVQFYAILDMGFLTRQHLPPVRLQDDAFSYFLFPDVPTCCREIPGQAEIFFFFIITLKPRVEWYKSLWALNTSRNLHYPHSGLCMYFVNEL